MKVLQIICRTQQILMNRIITSYLPGSEAENNHFLVAIERFGIPTAHINLNYKWMLRQPEYGKIQPDQQQLSHCSGTRSDSWYPETATEQKG